MSFEHTDVGGISQRLSEIFYDQALGDISASLSEKEESLLTTEDQSRKEPKYGDCYIFDYQEFLDGSPPRIGSEKDVARLRHDFTELNFNVHSDSECDKKKKYLNLTKQQTLDTLKEAAKNVPKQSKCFVCCFLTHGDKGGKLLMYDKYIQVEDILKCFSHSACPNLSGIPKIFIFQACRGEFGEEGVLCDSTDSGSEIVVPDYRDFLLVYSTYEGKVSFKRIPYGTFFIDELCRTLEQFSSKLDLFQILTIVNYRVAHFYRSIHTKVKWHKKKQMPGFTSRLTCKVKFNRQIKPFETEDTRYFDDRRSDSELGKKSTIFPLEDEKIYNIQKLEENKRKIKFLCLINTENDFGEDLKDCVAYLWSSAASSGYQIDRLKDNKGNDVWSKKEMTDFLKVAVQDPSKIDCLICFVACQAKGKYLCDNKGKKFLKEEIVELFTGKACEGLRGKPKIFIFMTFSMPKKSWFPCVSAESTDGDRSSIIPVHSDLLEVTITIQEKEQLFDVTEKFCYIFESKSSEDFISQLTTMNGELSSKNLPTICLDSTLTKTLILNKPE